MAELPRNIRVTELIPVIHIRPPMVLNVSPRTFDTVVETLLRVLLVFSRRSIPSTRPLPIRSGRWSTLWRSILR